MWHESLWHGLYTWDKLTSGYFIGSRMTRKYSHIRCSIKVKGTKKSTALWIVNASGTLLPSSKTISPLQMAYTHTYVYLIRFLETRRSSEDFSNLALGRYLGTYELQLLLDSKQLDSVVYTNSGKTNRKIIIDVMNGWYAWQIPGGYMDICV